MSYSLIEYVEGFDTLALQEQPPELFDVTWRRGVESWRLRPRARAALLEMREAIERTNTLALPINRQ